MTIRFDGQVAIVTGAGGGLGREHALALARRGAKVVVNDLGGARDGSGGSATAAEAVVAEIIAAGGEAMANAASVTDFPAVEAMVAAAMAKWGRVDILVNNAGVSGSHPDLLNIDTWDEQMNVNAKGVFLGMRAVIPAMQRAGGGSIVNISSISGFVGQRFVHMGYNAAKGAVRLATKAAAVQFARENIRVNSVHPGIMPAMRTSQMTADPAVRAKMIAAVPAGREGRIEEVAYANLFLASDEASYITGIEVPVDGGFLAQ